MNKETKDSIIKLEHLFKRNYENLELLSRSLNGSGMNLDPQKRISMSQRMLMETCAAVNELVSSLQENPEKRIQFNALDLDYEEQVSKAMDIYEQQYGRKIYQTDHNSFGGKVIASFSPEDYEGGIEELLTMIIKNNPDDEGGTLVGSK